MSVPHIHEDELDERTERARFGHLVIAGGKGTTYFFEHQSGCPGCLAVDSLERDFAEVREANQRLHSISADWQRAVFEKEAAEEALTRIASHYDATRVDVCKRIARGALSLQGVMGRWLRKSDPVQDCDHGITLGVYVERCAECGAEVTRRMSEEPVLHAELAEFREALTDALGCVNICPDHGKMPDGISSPKRDNILRVLSLSDEDK